MSTTETKADAKDEPDDRILVSIGLSRRQLRAILRDQRAHREMVEQIGNEVIRAVAAKAFLD